jgi:HlyD family secretion protein
MRKLIVLLLLLAAGGGIFYYTKYLHAETPPNLRTAEVERGELLITISATGTLEPEEVVDVGAQVMGRISELGPDRRGETDPAYRDKHVDYNSEVREGDLLARIDPALFKATRDQAQASLERAKADLLHLEAKYNQALAEYQRAERLREVKIGSLSSMAQRGGVPIPSTIKGISDADFVLAKANYEVAKANLEVGKAAVAQQEAALFSAQTNLDYTVITSPVNGTIIDRRVNIGQTVVASLNAPSLFLIALDLRRMEIWTAVNEADIGRIRRGMPVHFTVDAFPNEVFHGEVSEVRLNAEMQNHVVVYRVIVTTPNEDLKLLPYLSAHVKFEVDRRQDALLVPNAALRYTPRPDLVMTDEERAVVLGKSSASQTGDDTEVRTAASEDESEGLTTQDADAQQDVEDAESEKAADEKESEPTEDAVPRRVWVRHGNKVYPVDVLAGVSDGTMTEIVAGDLEPGMQVVLGEELAEVVAETTNPLAPLRFRGKKKKS